MTTPDFDRVDGKVAVVRAISSLRDVSLKYIDILRTTYAAMKDFRSHLGRPPLATIVVRQPCSALSYSKLGWGILGTP